MTISYDTIMMVCVMYLFAWLVAPPLAYDFIYRLIAIVATVIWFLCHMSRNNYRYVIVTRHKKSYVVYSIIYCIIHIACRCVFDDLSLTNAIYSDITTIIMLVIGYIAACYVEEGRSDELLKVFHFALLVAVLFSITSIFRAPKYEGLTRNAGSNMNDTLFALAREGALHGVGGFGFFCFTSVFAPLVLWYARIMKGFKKWILYGCFAIIEIGVLSAGYTLATMISFCGIVLCIFLTVNSNVTKFLIILALVFFLLFWDAFSRSLYNVLISLTTGTAYQVKVNDIFSFLFEGSSTGTFLAREERYIWSLMSIFKYPVFGSYLIEGIRSAGNHSSVLDTFAVYGWGVGLIWLYISMAFPVVLARPRNRIMKVFYFIGLFLTGLFNQYVMMMGAFYLLIPAVNSLDMNRD